MKRIQTLFTRAYFFHTILQCHQKCHECFILNYKSHISSVCRRVSSVSGQELTFPRFRRISKNRLYISLVLDRPRPATLLEKKLWRRCFSVNFAKLLKHLFLQNTPSGCFLKWLEQKQTSQLICSANQLTGFYMMGTLVIKGLNPAVKRSEQQS